ncbi:MAG TPA: SDR family oxidoreductase [Niabella sp.]|nr:SDR family oxidoreductase [Niabella sp.]HQW14677.1 SDR family oxidoreductase [Niabella sp.]HQX19816.1 SDR family oxidoreductase [Niabella sp.]HQX42281.1 SDR family oxidoreductase [Niabella sp.]HRB08334.1 SDR family oxidoreductase [Niabella sp.]
MKIFVTGATGYIGSHLVKKLSEQGHTIHALVRSLEKSKHIHFSNILFFQGDILDASSIEKAMEGCDQVYHLAAFAKVWAKDAKTFFDINVLATNHILDAAKKHKIIRVVVTSTAGVFGATLPNQTITENSVRNFDFFNEYESSKAFSESKIKDYVIDGLDVVIVSPTRVYGPYLFGQPESVTQLIEKYVLGNWRFIPGDGSKIGNYVFVEDVVLGHILAMEKGKKGHTYILGGTNHDYNTFFAKLSKISGIKRKMIYMPILFQMAFARLQLIKTWLGKEPLITPKWIAKGKYDWHVTPQKAIDELGINLTSLDEGLKKTVEWLRRR